MVTKKSSTPKDPQFTEKKISSGDTSIKKKKIVRKSSSGDSGNTKKSSESIKKDKIKKDLIDIYKDKTVDTRDMRSYKYKKGGGVFRAFLTLLFALIFLGAISWLGFFVFGVGSKFSENDVVLTVSGEENVAAGQEVQYRIRYKNTQQTSIKDVELKIHYPDGFVFDRATMDPSGENSDLWTFDEIKAGDGGTFDIFGRAYMNLGESQSVRAFLTYTPGNFSSEFQKVATLNTTVSKSDIGLAVNMQREISRAFETPISITITDLHTLDKSITRAVLSINAPGVSVKNRENKTGDLLDTEWNLDAEKKSEDVSFSASFDPDGSEGQQMTVRVIGLREGQLLENGFVLAEKTIDFSVVDTTVSSIVIINGGIGDLAVQPGEKMNTSVVVKNSGADPLKDVRVRLVYDAPSAKGQSILYWSKLDDPEDGVINGEQMDETTRRGEIVWTKAQVPALASIGEGESVTIDVTLPVKDSSITDLTAFETYTAKVFADVEYKGVDDTTIVSSNPVNITLNSDTQFEVRSKINDSVSGGPMYTLTWLINNTFHELKNIKVSADFFGDVTFDEASILAPPAGKTVIDNGTRRIVWTVESMPTALDVLAYQFNVQLKKANAGQTQFTSKITFEAEDTVTGKKILNAVEPIDL